MSCKQNQLIIFLFVSLSIIVIFDFTMSNKIHIVKAKFLFFSKFAIDLNVFLFISKLVTTVLFKCMEYDF